AVSDQNIGPEAEQKVGETVFPAEEDDPRQLVGGAGLVKKIGRPADLKGGIRRQDDIPAKPVCSHFILKRLDGERYRGRSHISWFVRRVYRYSGSGSTSASAGGCPATFLILS